MKRPAAAGQARACSRLAGNSSCVAPAPLRRAELLDCPTQNGTPTQRRARLDSHMRALNTQFSRHVLACVCALWPALSTDARGCPAGSNVSWSSVHRRRGHRRCSST